MLKTGETLWNGAIVTASLATAYNSLQARIVSFQNAGKPVPEYLLNGAHNLINSAMPESQNSAMPESQNLAYDALRALDVPAMTQTAIYEMRDSIGHLIASAKWDAREYCDYPETRARGIAQRHYIETCQIRLESVTRP